MAPVSALSAFLYHTLVLAMFIPALQDWAKRHGRSTSRPMLPLKNLADATRGPHPGYTP